MSLTLEERVARIESTLEMMQQKQLPSVPSASAASGWRNLLGTFDDDPVFEEIVRQGRLYRESQLPRYDEPAQP